VGVNVLMLQFFLPILMKTQIENDTFLTILRIPTRCAVC
jgi:hypothetical protein